MTTGKSDGDSKFKQPAQGVQKQVKFIMNLESDSECVQKVTFGEISDKVRFRHRDGSSTQNNGRKMDVKGVPSRKDVHVRHDSVGFSSRAEVNKRGQEDQEVRAGLMGDGQELSEEDESRNNEALDDVEDGNWHLPDAKVQLPGPALPQQQPQIQGPVIRWERFLAQRCLKVLLVENDDSTRQVVSALLRNCSYEVTAVANGQQAWKLLEDPSNHFDIVLTEVVMPCLSGIGLLCKIMSHQNCKNIPVIMMSTHDSMGIVFKCLSKGAVDFLVKPVRKNELKNLWQHVWRRCHSSSGSGSETGSQTKNVVTLNGEADLDNNTGSNDDSDDASIGLNIRDGSDNGSGTQSSWTKRAVEVESPRHRSEWDLGRSHCSTIAQVIQPKIGIVQNEWMPPSGTSRECKDEKPYDFAMGKDLEMAVHGQIDVEAGQNQDDKALCNQAYAREEKAALASSAEGDEIEEPMDTDGSPGETSTKAADLIGTIASKPKSRNVELEDCVSREVPERWVTTQMKDKTVADFKHLPFLELTLKRPRQNGEEDGEGEDRHVLRQSGASAFSRYNTNGTQVSHPSGDSFQPNSLSKGYVGQCCMTSASLESGKTGSLRAAVPTERVASSKGSGGDASTPAPVHNQLSQSSNNQDLGSSVVGPGQEVFPRPMPAKDDMLSVSATNAGPQTGKSMSMHPVVMSYDSVPAVYGSGVHPIYYSNNGPSLWGSEAQNPNERGEICNTSTQTEQQLLGTRVHHHHHHVQHVHHHHHHHQNRQHKHGHEHPNQNEHSMNNVTMTAPRCGSSNVVGCTPDGNNGQSGSNNGYGSNGNGNSSVNGSASGSNNGSNGQNGHSNGQSSAAVTPGTNGESDTGNGVKSSIGGGSGSGSGVDQNRSAQREAALTKFRQKRKERCFEKKVRYQSRKRLAEQRPRVRGQFVRQPIYEPTSTDAD